MAGADSERFSCRPPPPPPSPPPPPLLRRRRTQLPPADRPVWRARFPRPIFGLGDRPIRLVGWSAHSGGAPAFAILRLLLRCVRPPTLSLPRDGLLHRGRDSRGRGGPSHLFHPRALRSWHTRGASLEPSSIASHLSAPLPHASPQPPLLSLPPLLALARRRRRTRFGELAGHGGGRAAGGEGREGADPPGDGAYGRLRVPGAPRAPPPALSGPPPPRVVSVAEAEVSRGRVRSDFRRVDRGGRVRRASGEGGRKARRQGVPREEHGPWDRAFPPIYAPARPPGR